MHLLVQASMPGTRCASTFASTRFLLESNARPPQTVLRCFCTSMGTENSIAPSLGWNWHCSNMRVSWFSTWLILPVVICLSQRLSHACPSLSRRKSETANGSLNLLQSNRRMIATWIPVASGELTHALYSPNSRVGVLVRLITNRGQTRSVIHKLIIRMTRPRGGHTSFE
jgi:hypothetical protein